MLGIGLGPVSYLLFCSCWGFRIGVTIRAGVKGHDVPFKRWRKERWNVCTNRYFLYHIFCRIRAMVRGKVRVRLGSGIALRVTRVRVREMVDKKNLADQGMDRLYKQVC